MGENGPASMTVGVPKFSHLCSVCGATLHNCMPLSRSLTELIARHESLRVTIPPSPISQGGLVKTGLFAAGLYRQCATPATSADLEV